MTETKTSPNGVIYNNYGNDIYFYNCKTVDDVKSYIEKLTKTRTEEITQYKKDIANVKKITVAVNKLLESVAGYSRYTLKALGDDILPYALLHLRTNKK